MKPAPFGYSAPATVEEAVAQLAQDEDARPLAGGQSLVPLLNLRVSVPSRLVDLRRIPGLDAIECGPSAVTFGAMVRQSRALADASVAEACPIVPAALQHVGHPQTRSRGTIGGSIALADPAAELAAALLAVDGEVDAIGSAGERRIAAADLFCGHYSTTLEPSEIIVAVRFPAARGAGAACVEISRRRRDFAMVGAVAQVVLAPDGSIADARIALFAVADRPVRAHDVEAALRGREADPAVVTEATARWAPPGEGEPAYSHQVAPVMVRRAVEQALERAA